MQDSNELARYGRQMLFSALGERGQRRLLEARVVVIGCGATGSVIANHLARAGVGYLRVVDRDFVELHNLHRQALLDEDDARQALPKAVAIARKLRQINSQIAVEDIVADVHPGNVLGLIQDVDLVMDGTDNMETRYLINDACLHLGKPWIYTGVVASYGMTMTILPHETACLRCVMPEPPGSGTLATCDTAGVLGPTVAVVASMAAGEALKWLADMGSMNRGLLYFDLMESRLERFATGDPRSDCPACGRGEYAFLNAQVGTRSITLCGREAVQISTSGELSLELEQLARTLKGVGRVRVTPYLLQAEVDGRQLTIFPDGRVIIKGVDDPAIARALYARYIGH
ncbi:MAG: ThiF family adenylyltransferase [Anaerolineae bacterium]|nr:ThiF family adenylyltransferase [Anaerolineae bacterium]MDW8098083.1 ThiF family adenylyltransferase [Anaerolineae bacterium]